MMGRPGPCLLLLVVASVAGEYTWTGTDWKWQNPEDTRDPVLGGGGGGGVIEASGDEGYDDEEDDDSYDYEEEDYDYSVPKQSGNLPTLELPEKTPKKTPKKTVVKTPPTFGFDDEDLSEGSGGFDDEDEDMEEGSGDGGFGGNSWRDTVTQPPRRVEEPFRPNVVKPAEEEEELYVDGNNYNQYVPPKEDVFFGRDDKEDNRNRVVVSTTETTRKHYDAKPTESPEVHRVPPTRNVSFFAQPGILAAVIGGAVVGLLCAILLVMFIVYRMRKKDEGSYALDEPKRAHNANSYSKPPSREFYA
jgi:syndecan 2